MTRSLQTREGKSGEGLETQAARVLPGRAREVVAGTGRSSSSWQHGQQRQQGQRGWSSSQNQSWRGSWSGNQSRSSWQPKAKAAEPKAAEPKAAAVPDDSWGDALPAAKPPAPIPKPAMELPPPPKAPVMIAEPKMPPMKNPPPPKQAGAGVPKSEPPVKAAPKAHGIPAIR